MWQYWLNILTCGHLLGNVLVTLFLLLVAGTNYPGGVAMSRLHRLVDSQGTNVTVHIGNFAAQSGVSRFTEINPKWTYFKDDLTPVDINAKAFSHLLVEGKSKHSLEIKYFSNAYNVLEFVECFDHIGIQYKSILPVRIKTRPCIFILERKNEKDIIRDFHNSDFEGLMGKAREDIAEPESNHPITEPIPEGNNLESNKDTEEAAEISILEDHEENIIQEMISSMEEYRESIQEPGVVQEETLEDDDVPTETSKKSKTKRRNKLNAELLKEIINKQKNKRAKEVKDNGSGGKPALNKVIKGNRISNIKKIIKTDEIRHLVEDIGRLDLSEYCELETESTKECLLKIIEQIEINDD